MGDVWIALRWAAASLHQTKRVYASLDPYLSSHRSRIGVGVVRITPEMQRPSAIFWSDVLLAGGVVILAVRSLIRSGRSKTQP